jgi:DNA-directed RNA polymerase specialized sigma24 family protein
METIFTRNYDKLRIYAENLLYRMPWLQTKGHTAKDAVHDAYLLYVQYGAKFEDYPDEKTVQILKNLVYWTVKGFAKKDREHTLPFEQTLSGQPAVEHALFNKELVKAVNKMEPDEAEMFNMRLAGYSYSEINSKFNISNSRTLIDSSMSKVADMFGMYTASNPLGETLGNFVKDKVSISEISRKTGLSPYIVKKQVKGLLGERYREYSKQTQKKKRRT